MLSLRYDVTRMPSKHRAFSTTVSLTIKRILIEAPLMSKQNQQGSHHSSSSSLIPTPPLRYSGGYPLAASSEVCEGWSTHLIALKTEHYPEAY